MSSPHYSKAPITESILDIRVQLPADVVREDLLKLLPLVRPQYPHMQLTNLLHGEVTVEADVAHSSASQTEYGCTFISENGKQIFQARLDGFAFNRLAPYESWEPFINEAHRCWTLYRQVVEPEAITRVAVRTVNRLNLPGPQLDFSTYLRTLPDISNDLQPGGVSTYFMQLQIPQPDIDGMLLLNEVFLPSEDLDGEPDIHSVILDIDLFIEGDLQDEEYMWSLFDKLHARRNHVFEACITDEARRLFQW
jgi:uncharacterized protein (TIGR04255 family)